MSINQAHKKIERPPVVVIMGHIDHGKSTLLDFIRQSNIVAKESGGITQHLGAYEIEHKIENGSKKITFLDTPGHEAFIAIRDRGAKVADIAILIVSAEDGVKPQTLEALKCIKDDGLPFIVAINKIDSPKANIEGTKSNLIENEIYIEGYGGDIPVVEISALAGTNVSDLLETIILVAEINDFQAETDIPASGFIIETHKDKNKGISATMLIKDGSLKTGQFVSAENACAPIRQIEDQNKKSLKEATFSTPVTIHGWNEIPKVGSEFQIFNSKKEAEKFIQENQKAKPEEENKNKENLFNIPILFKADSQGSLDAIEHELSKIKLENAFIKIIDKSTGNISESDIKNASGDLKTIIVGFGIKIDNAAKAMCEKLNIEVKTFSIIYELTDWLKEKIEELRPKIETEELRGEAKILKVFSRVKNIQVVGGKVKEGFIKIGNKVKIIRREEQIGTGIIKELQQAKSKTTEVLEDSEFGMSLESRIEIAPGDIIQSVEITKR